jgi:hypothetical protein
MPPQKNKRVKKSGIFQQRPPRLAASLDAARGQRAARFLIPKSVRHLRRERRVAMLCQSI